MQKTTFGLANCAFAYQPAFSLSVGVYNKNLIINNFNLYFLLIDKYKVLKKYKNIINNRCGYLSTLRIYLNNLSYYGKIINIKYLHFKNKCKKQI